MAVVYIHTRKDNGEVFYVGIGENKKRAYSLKSRNRFWIDIVSHYGFNVKIVYGDIEWTEACKIEKELITKYGRVDIKTGTLVNLTSGGQGTEGVLVSEETRAKITKSKTGKKRPPISETARRNLKEAMKGKTPKNFHTLHTTLNEKRIAGIKGSFSKETIQMRSGRWAGSANPRTTEVINVETGIFYENLNEAYKASGLSVCRPFFSMMLLGARKNYTQFRSLKNIS